MIGSKFKKKRMLGLFIVLFALGLSSLTADDPRTLYTPRNTLVPDTYTCDEMSDSLRAELDSTYASNYPNAEQLTLWGEEYSSSERYNCHGYAWHMIGDDAINDPVWIGYYWPGEVQIYWQDGSYGEVSSSIATHVKYNTNHSATTTDQQDIYISKWGSVPLMRHHKDYHPVSYGSPNNFLERSLDVPQDYSTIQAAINAAAYGQTVHVSSGTYSGTINMKNGVDVRSTSGKPLINGNINFDGLYGFTTLENFRVGDGYTVSVDNYSGVILDGITSISNEGNAIEVLLYSCVDVIDFNSTLGVVKGIHAYDADDIILDGLQIESADTALYQRYSYVELYDSYFCDNDYDIYKAHCNIYIEEDNTFSGDIGDVTSGLYQDEYPEWYDICGFKKAISDQSSDRVAESTGDASSSTADNDAFNRGISLLRELNRQRIAAIRADSSWNAQDFIGQYAEAIGLLKQAVAESYDNEMVWRSAIGKIISSYWRLGQPEEVLKYLSTLRNDSRYAELRPYIDRRLMSYYTRQGEPSKALEIADALLASPLDEQPRAGILYQTGNIYRHYLDDPSQAAVYFWQLVADYPDNPVTEMALRRLEEMGEYVPGGSPIEPEPVEALALEGYPNPFNPTATIRFGLPEAGKVTLVIYDLMGREVVRLVEGGRDAGWQAVVWDGRDARGREVPTGIYIARLSIIPPTAGVTPQGTKAIKLVMMK